MKVLSTNSGKPRRILWQEEEVTTGIFKNPVPSITVRKFFVEGDTVADLRVHGGENKAVYGYPSEHYAFWRSQYPEVMMDWGMFGENITTEGLLEKDIIIGSIYRLGTALLEITQPRTPCYKLAAKFGSVGIIRQFVKSRKSGFYFTVLEEGVIHPGDTITLEEAGNSGYTIEEEFADRERNNS